MSMADAYTDVRCWVDAVRKLPLALLLLLLALLLLLLLSSSNITPDDDGLNSSVAPGLFSESGGSAVDEDEGLPLAASLLASLDRCCCCCADTTKLTLPKLVDVREGDDERGDIASGEPGRWCPASSAVHARRRSRSRRAAVSIR